LKIGENPVQVNVEVNIAHHSTRNESNERTKQKFHMQLKRRKMENFHMHLIEEMEKKSNCKKHTTLGCVCCRVWAWALHSLDTSLLASI